MPTKTKRRLAAPDDDVELNIRLESDDVACVAMSQAESAMLDDAIPWRTFRMYFGQTHYSGAYWSATEAAHVIYESRLELSRLLLADFAADVTHIVAQPFLMRARVDGVRRRHIPDYFLMTGQGPVIVDVKPRDKLDDPKVVDTFAWVRSALQTKGWRFEVASEPPPILLENVRFLAGYRRRPYISPTALEELRSLNLEGITFGDALRRVKTSPPPSARSALLHMLWSREVSANLDEVLTDESVLGTGATS
jgi:hypothetical protein